jgi:hypothetical protein
VPCRLSALAEQDLEEIGSYVAEAASPATTDRLIDAIIDRIAGSGDGYVLPSAKWGAPVLLSGLGSIGGMLVDRAHKPQQLVYVASESLAKFLVSACESKRPWTRSDRSLALCHYVPQRKTPTFRST